MTKERMRNINDTTDNWEAKVAEAEVLAANRSVPLTERTRRFFKIVDAVFDPVKPFVVCGSGCSHCCRQAVFISSAEAKLISDFTGKPTTLERNTFLDAQYAKDAQDRRVDTPCSFLVEGQCSIYEVRPVACRIHFSTSDDREDCSMENHFKGNTVSLLDTATFTDPYLKMNRPKSFLADINDFFPPA